MNEKRKSWLDLLDTINFLGELGLVCVNGEEENRRNYATFSLRKLKLIKKHIYLCPKCGNDKLIYDGFKADNEKIEMFRCDACKHKNTLFFFMNKASQITYTSRLKTLISQHLTVCDICGSNQIELIDWTTDIELKCRKCKTRGFKIESYMSTPSKKELKELSLSEFNKLKEIGWLYEFYPDAPDKYDEIPRKELDADRNL
ncbi:MAG: hypothetical protein H8E12_17085 [Rhodobacteraceae bacterium]|nr:hypothetical protein [Paracoccaceae bacterium]